MNKGRSRELRPGGRPTGQLGSTSRWACGGRRKARVGGVGSRVHLPLSSKWGWPGPAGCGARRAGLPGRPGRPAGPAATKLLLISAPGSGAGSASAAGWTRFTVSTSTTSWFRGGMCLAVSPSLPLTLESTWISEMFDPALDTTRSFPICPRACDPNGWVIFSDGWHSRPAAHQHAPWLNVEWRLVMMRNSTAITAVIYAEDKSGECTARVVR